MKRKFNKLKKKRNLKTRGIPRKKKERENTWRRSEADNRLVTAGEGGTGRTTLMGGSG